MNTINPEQQYAANIFLSNFSEQHAFENHVFSVGNPNINDLINFAYIYCKINKRSLLSTAQIGNSYYYTLSLTDTNTVLYRHFGLTLSEEEAARFPVNSDASSSYQSFYSDRTFYFPAADGENYNRLTIVKQIESLEDGRYRMYFDIYKLDIDEYWRANGVDSGFYALNSTEAAQDYRLSWEKAGTAIVIPFTRDGIATYQLLGYSVDGAVEEPSSESKIIHFRRNNEVKYECTFNSELFSNNSSVRNNDLALFAGMLSLGVYHDLDATILRDIYSELGINSNNIYDPTKDVKSREESFQFSVAEKELYIDGEKTIILMIVLRGTLTHDEKMGDHYTKADTDLPGLDCKAYGFVYKFADTVYHYLQTFVEDHPELNGEKVKVLVTGHSLGGAGANLLGYFINNSIASGGWYNVHDKEDVYVYTFGAIDSINSKKNINEGYENIHNITNYFDNFGPNGWVAFTAAGNSRYGKFGHIDLFFDDRDKGSLTDVQNHLMWTYLDAVVGHNVIYDRMNCMRYAGLHCPVDINVYKNNSLVAQVTNEAVTYDTMEIPLFISDGEKYFLLTDNDDYRFEITATDYGSMSCEFGDMTAENNEAVFAEVGLEPETRMRAEVLSGKQTSETRIYVTDSGGVSVAEVHSDGTEIAMDSTKIIVDTPGTATQSSNSSVIPSGDILWGAIAAVGLLVSLISLVLLLATRDGTNSKSKRY